MRVFTWLPYRLLGGGKRLLDRLAPAIAAQPGVEQVTVAAPRDHLASSPLPSASGVRTIELDPPVGSLRTRFNVTGRVMGIPGTGHLKSKLCQRLELLAAREATRRIVTLSAESDVVYAFWPHRQLYPGFSKPIVCTIQDVTQCVMPELLGAEMARAEIAQTREWICSAQEIVVSSRATAANLARLFGFEPNITVIHHAILPDATAEADPASSELRRHLPERYIVYPAQLSAHKNHENLLRAWARFPHRDRIGLVLFGNSIDQLNRPIEDTLPSPHACRMAGLMWRLNLKPARDFAALGYVPASEILPLVAGADALIMPSLCEGGGSYPVEEALQLGIPVLCSDIPVMREHLADRTARIGWFDPESPDSILAALCDLCDHFTQYRESAKRGRQDPRPSWDDIGAQYVEVFRRALSAPPRQRD